MIHRYIGPVHYCVDGPEKILDMIPKDDFSQPPHDPVVKDISVILRRIPHIELPDRDIITGNLCDICIIDDQEYRFFYDIVHGEKYYCVRVSESSDRIVVEYESSTECFPLDISRFDNCLLLEKKLLDADACILHSSSILYRGRAVLFTAPSGTGKSTQADLWKANRDCTVLNGDRNIVGLQNGAAYSFGLPWHGNSAYCRNYQAPLGAIVVIRQAPEDSVVTLSAVEQFYMMYSELTVNTWNTDYVNRIMDLIPGILDRVPVFLLNCTMNTSAVDVLDDHLAEYWR